jgi:hypothetical protein
MQIKSIRLDIFYTGISVVFQVKRQTGDSGCRGVKFSWEKLKNKALTVGIILEINNI